VEVKNYPRNKSYIISSSSFRHHPKFIKKVNAENAAQTAYEKEIARKTTASASGSSGSSSSSRNFSLLYSYRSSPAVKSFMKSMDKTTNKKISYAPTKTAFKLAGASWDVESCFSRYSRYNK